MEVTIYETDEGKSKVNVRGSESDRPEEIAETFLKVKEALKKGEQAG